MKVSKKWLIVFLVLLTVSISLIYILIPGEWEVSGTCRTTCNISAAFRSISDGTSWQKWWPENTNRKASYLVTGNAYPEVGVILQTDDHKIPGIVSVLAGGLSDSIILFWKCRFICGLNPIERIRQYREAIGTKKTIDAGLSSMASFLKKGENVYGMEVKNSMLMDSTLLVMSLRTPEYPSMTEVYRRIHLMREYVSGQGARETDYPMLHVSFVRDSGYQSMVAIPVDRELRARSGISPVRFVPWKVLTGEVRGGTAVAERAMDQLQLYVTDHQKTAMALAFQSLVTERDREPDTARWITRVVVPVP